MRFVLPLLSCLTLAACGEAVKDDHFANNFEPEQVDSTPYERGTQAVRIGELGPSFAACNARGTTRRPESGASLPVRAAPFDDAAVAGAIAAGTQFFVCSRSLDQRWLGVVYDGSGTLAQNCGVSAPVELRVAYEGPCRSGWVESAFVKLMAG
jgi:hypothetical protein